jgi:hypothetical protein
MQLKKTSSHVIDAARFIRDPFVLSLSKHSPSTGLRANGIHG